MKSKCLCLWRLKTWPMQENDVKEIKWGKYNKLRQVAANGSEWKGRASFDSNWKARKHEMRKLKWRKWFWVVVMQVLKSAGKRCGCRCLCWRPEREGKTWIVAKVVGRVRRKRLTTTTMEEDTLTHEWRSHSGNGVRFHKRISKRSTEAEDSKDKKKDKKTMITLKVRRGRERKRESKKRKSMGFKGESKRVKAENKCVNWNRRNSVAKMRKKRKK